MFSLFRPQARYTQHWSGAVVVLAPGPLPAGAVRQFDFRMVNIAPEQLPEGAFVIIVCHAAAGWLHWLAGAAPHALERLGLPDG